MEREAPRRGPLVGWRPGGAFRFCRSGRDRSRRMCGRARWRAGRAPERPLRSASAVRDGKRVVVPSRSTGDAWWRQPGGDRSRTSMSFTVCLHLPDGSVVGDPFRVSGNPRAQNPPSSSNQVASRGNPGLARHDERMTQPWSSVPPPSLSVASTSASVVARPRRRRPANSDSAGPSTFDARNRA
jgi:hypothetical protein